MKGNIDGHDLEKNKMDSKWKNVLEYLQLGMWSDVLNFNYLFSFEWLGGWELKNWKIFLLACQVYYILS